MVIVPRYNSFSVAGPATSNSPQTSKLPIISLNVIDSFRLQLKTFLSRVSKLTHDIDIAILSVLLSVRPSVRPSVRDTLVLYENDLTYCHSFITIW